jgi:hypothetical protein
MIANDFCEQGPIHSKEETRGHSKFLLYEIMARYYIAEFPVQYKIYREELAAINNPNVPFYVRSHVKENYA